MATERPEGLSGQTGPYARFVRWMENLTETQFAYFLLTPALLLLGVVAFWPLLSTFRLSLFADNITGVGAVGEHRSAGLAGRLAALVGEQALEPRGPVTGAAGRTGRRLGRLGVRE
jgi:multiple sugar transport system permease protein